MLRSIFKDLKNLSEKRRKIILAVWLLVVGCGAVVSFVSLNYYLLPTITGFFVSLARSILSKNFFDFIFEEGRLGGCLFLVMIECIIFFGAFDCFKQLFRLKWPKKRLTRIDSGELKMSDCPFCSKKNLGSLNMFSCYGGFSVIASLYPASKIGHFLLIPRRHVKNFGELTVLEKCFFFLAVSTAYFRIKKIFNKPLNFLFNEGRPAGQTLDHFHAHFIVREEGDGINNFGANVAKEQIGQEAVAIFKKMFKK